MDQSLVISLRVVHILTGAAWVGAVLFISGFILPAAATEGRRIGGRFLNLLLDRKWLSLYITSIEGLAVLTGAVLYWNASGGLQAEWIQSGPGLAFTVGATAAIVSLVVSAPFSASLGKAYYLVKDVEPRSSDREYAIVHSRLKRLSVVYSILLIIAVGGMASASYLN